MDWKTLFDEEEREIDRVLEEINNDPKFEEVVPSPEVCEELFAKIHEYQNQYKSDTLSNEEKELIRLGKCYKKRRKVERYAILVAAVVTMLAIGTVSIGENKNIVSLLKQIFAGGEITEINSEGIEPTVYVEEEELYEEIESKYGFTPVKLEYLPQDLKFQEAVFYTETQAMYLYYGIQNSTDITYIIWPNYRQSSIGSVVEDEILQEYKIFIHDTEVSLTEYRIKDSGENRWSVLWMYEDVQYMLNITDMTQAETEKIVETLRFVK